MTTSNLSSVLKDVVAYVDVWSSDKMANCSKPFIEQLQEMGAQVSKTFNKQVTHVIFYNGHPATWRKAKKNNVRLVSVLWIERCHDDCVHVDEELFPALNDESNPVLRNKRHRCMQPKDSPEKTPENDRRMKKKLDKMMKDLLPKPPLVPATHVSSIIIDKENGIVYSPALKRSDYMARRLKDMKDKRENLSPTASQMVESCSPTGLKPSLGSTPAILRLTFEESDEDSSVSVAESFFSPDRNEGREHPNDTELEHLEQCHMKDSIKPWESPRHYIPKCTSSVSHCSDQEGKKDEEGNKRKLKRSPVRKTSGEKAISVGFLESTCQKRRSSKSKNVFKDSRQSHIIPFCQTLHKSERHKTGAAESITETEAHVYSDTLKSASCSTSAVIDSAEKSEETAAPLLKAEPKTHKRAISSFSALVQSLGLSGESKNVAAVPSSGDDSFEDFFSPANHHQRPKNGLSSNVGERGRIHIPFELEPPPKKKKQRRSESWGSESICKKIRKLEDVKSQNVNQEFDTSDESQTHQQRDVKKSLPAVGSPGVNVKLMDKKQGQSTLFFTPTSTTSEKVRLSQHMPAQLTEDNAVPDLRKDSEVNSLPHTLESRGSNCTVAADFTESPSEPEENQKKKVSLSLQTMVHKTKKALTADSQLVDQISECDRKVGMRTLVMTSMPTEKQHTLVQVVKALGGFSIVDRVCESTTHVVSGEHKRTLNILLGIVRGCWILSFEWILWCLEQRQWIPEEPYELSDQFPAGQICRLQRHLSAGEHQQDLFEGLPAMFVSQHSQPPTQSLVELIELCGGTVCRTVRQAGICIGKYNGRRPEGSRILSEQWVLDSITQLKQLSYDNYDLE